MKIALGQVAGTPLDVAANLQLAERLAGQAAGRGAELLVLPELFLTGYNIGDAIDRLAESCDGASARAMARIAAASGLAIVYGYPERVPDGVYNAAAVIGADGNLAATYRKLCLWGPFERRHFRPGAGAASAVLGGLRFDLQICYDLDFPQLSRAAARSGADGVLCISATSKPYTVVPRHIVPTRAYENQLFVVFANRPGVEDGLSYAGESCVAAPDGSFLATSDAGETLLFAEIDSLRYADFVRDHRPADFGPRA